MRLARILTRLISLQRKEGHALPRSHVFRLIEAQQVEDQWFRRIIEQADGKLIGEMAEKLYREELEQGAWLADIGLWKERFEQELVQAVGNLAALGHLHLAPCIVPDPARPHHECKPANMPPDFSN